jgi:hypothetical protein
MKAALIRIQGSKPELLKRYNAAAKGRSGRMAAACCHATGKDLPGFVVCLGCTR